MRTTLTLLLAASLSTACTGGVYAGSGGSSTASVSTSSTSSNSSAGFGEPCAGPDAIPCALPSLQCWFDTTASCGANGAFGKCLGVPESCPPQYDCAYVCGCDGRTYCNECEAGMSRASVAFFGACDTPQGTWRASNLFNDVVPTFVLLGTFAERDVCIAAVVQKVPVDGAGLGITGDGWDLAELLVTHHAADCDAQPWSSPQSSEILESYYVDGDLRVVEQSTGGCSAWIDGTAYLGALTVSWANVVEILYTAMPIPIEGGCP
jgi:hypothetical protein